MKLDATPQVTIAIISAGDTLVEYDDADDARLSDTVGVKYIEAKPESHFSVALTTNGEIFAQRNEREMLGCGVFLDGIWAEGKLLEPQSHINGKLHSQLVGKFNNEQNTLERFKFAELETSDESVAGLQSERFKHVGEIKVVLRWVLVLPEPARTVRNFKPVADGKIPEKCLKGRAISRRAILDDAERTRPPPRLRVDLQKEIAPFATFVFKYRSRRDLQIEGIIPRDPSPAPKSPVSLEERNIDELSLEEARERLRRQARGEEALQVKLKQEKRDAAHLVEDDDDDDEVAEVSSRNKRQRLSSSGKENIIEVSDDE